MTIANLAQKADRADSRNGVSGGIGPARPGTCPGSPVRLLRRRRGRMISGRHGLRGTTEVACTETSARRTGDLRAGPKRLSAGRFYRMRSLDTEDVNFDEPAICDRDRGGPSGPILSDAVTRHRRLNFDESVICDRDCDRDREDPSAGRCYRMRDSTREATATNWRFSLVSAVCPRVGPSDTTTQHGRRPRRTDHLLWPQWPARAPVYRIRQLDTAGVGCRVSRALVL